MSKDLAWTVVRMQNLIPVEDIAMFSGFGKKAIQQTFKRFLKTGLPHAASQDQRDIGRCCLLTNTDVRVQVFRPCRGVCSCA